MKTYFCKMRKKNVVLENIRMVSAGAKGVAVGRAENGKTVLVKGAVPGDLVHVNVRKSKSSYVEGDVKEFVEYSTDRVIPRCIHFGVCGGCKWQNLNYGKQLEYKENEVLNNIRRIGGISDFINESILEAPEQYYYRNKMEFSFSNSRWLTQEEIIGGTDFDNRNALGFHIPGMWSKILDLKECHLQISPSNEIRLAVKEYADAHSLDFFDPRSQEGFLRTLMLRQNAKGEWMVLFQLFRSEPENQQKLFEFLLSRFPQISTLLYAVNPKANDSVYDLDIEVFFGPGYLLEEMDGLKFKIGPKSFFQTNYKQALNLYRKTLDFAQLTGNEVVYDLYTGTGTIAQYLARSAKQVIGIEAVPEAIDAAREHAELNGLTNCSFYCGDMKEVFTENFLANHPPADVLVTDPPRDGMHSKVIEQIIKLAPERIVYVSCNSATQARDIALLKEHYKLVKILPVDMFPQTHHVENIALLVRV